MKYSGVENKIGGVVGAIRVVLLLLIAIAAYGMGIFPALLFPYMVLKFINLQDIFLILVFSLLLVIDYLILVFFIALFLCILHKYLPPEI